MRSSWGIDGRIYELLHYFLSPARQGAILITTRCQVLGTLALGLELSPMRPEEQRLLKERDMPLAHVAVESGFANQSHLTQAFKQYLGLTPRAYRQDRSI